MDEEREASSLFNLLDIPSFASISGRNMNSPPPHPQTLQIPKNSKTGTWLKQRGTGITKLWGRCVFPIG